jgi:hypothetical protein
MILKAIAASAAVASGLMVTSKAVIGEAVITIPAAVAGLLFSRGEIGSDTGLTVV